MGSREVPFSPNELCDNCGAKGAFDFMGDCLCPKCAGEAIPDEEDDDPRCVWTYDGSTCSWDTECKEKFQFNEGGPTDNGFDFCPYCGGSLKEEHAPKAQEGYGTCTRCGCSSDSLTPCLRCSSKLCEDCVQEDELVLGVCCDCASKEEE